MGLTTNVSENNSSVQACVNITRGSIESYNNYVYAYISTTGSGSAVGKSMLNSWLACWKFGLEKAFYVHKG